MRSPLHLAFGLYGVASVALGLQVWWQVVSGPGDDNAIAGVALLTAALGLLPAWGTVHWLARRPLRAHLLWLFFSSVSLVPLFGLLVVLLQVRR